MMVSFTPCCRKIDAAWYGLARLWLAGLFLAAWLIVSTSAAASDKSVVKKAAIRVAPQGYVLDADVDIALNPTLEDALAKGINLHFLLEFELTRPRDWWFDEDIVEPERKLRIYYHLLLRRYVVETGYVTRTAETLTDALDLLGRVNDWQVLERGMLKTGRRYDARLRLRLDTAQLPKPLTIGGVTSDQWDLVTPWYKWSFETPVTPPAPATPVPAPAPASASPVAPATPAAP